MKTLIVFKDGKARFVPDDVAERIWWCHEGGKKPHTRAQGAYIAHIRRVYLNRQSAPPEYLERHAIERGMDGPEQQSLWYNQYDNY